MPDPKTHSLSEAVADGVVTEKAAFCGLSKEDVQSLAISHPKAKVLVRFRSPHGDNRKVMSADGVVAFGKNAENAYIIDGITYRYSDIRDIMAVA